MRAVVIGAGAAGLMCAATLAHGGVDTLLIERNEKAGKKLYITGKGRCNLTNDCDVPTWLSKTVGGAKFLYSCAYAFPPSATKEFFEGRGLSLKTERGGRVFPVSDKSSDVIKALVKYAESGGVKFSFGERVVGIDFSDGRVKGIRSDKNSYDCDAVIVATGGVTYPSTGSTGDGYAFAQAAGMKVVAPKPSLVALTAKGVEGLQGLSLKNVRFGVYIDGKERASAFGEMLFTHRGVSGPIVLECSALTSKYRDGNGRFPKGSYAEIDFKPALDEETLDARLLRDFSSAPNAALRTVAAGLLPRALVGRILGYAGIDGDLSVCNVSKDARRRIVRALKCWKTELVGAEGAEQAIITSGGVATDGLDPRTMESRKVKGLYFVGEVIDVDSLTGGFNLQNAWATAVAAARAVCSQKG